ncbi:D-methionine transport system ATP-binding protein [Anaerocolumna jejuensis DSM 15929]|uniref:D-methionine transport system ATP-binding protein n=1 Tax=Anaerocolumna jejuensis DSM 15929 TaxID=1121322 RepID=A0A1M6MW02_9FIRM|nr:ATP-binding cassette domain-containing protein [Anaerocolumna jejuensis]SHJ87569.1 D-methionine transport system ATP-binding protein [Anaerocolumna jejuensis DSM 15929]
MIEVKQLTKEFSIAKDKKLTVLKDINLVIEDRDIFGIIGMSGAGKSTFIRCLNLLEKPTKGSILIDGVDITRKRGRQLLILRKQIGMIFQNFNLLMQKNVSRNIAFGLEITKARYFKIPGMSGREYEELGYFKKRSLKKKEIERRVDELLKLVDLEDKKYEYPSKLSGGQRQRVAIARALATYPSILLCDEATSALDSRTTESILKLLKKINEETGVTIVMITHEMNVVQKICNKVAVLDKSEIVASGYTKEVFGDTSSEIVAQLLGGEEA